MESSRRMFLVLLCVAVAASCAVAQDTEDGILPQSDVQPLLSDMIEQGFTVAAAVAQSFQSLIPIGSTLFIPTNNAIAAVATNLTQADIASSLQYHVLDFPTSFQALSRNPVGTELTTMLRGAVLTVTSNSPGSFAINSVNVTNPDLCSSTEFVACHGIDRVLFFNSSLGTAAAPNALSPFPAPQAPSPLSPQAVAPGTRTPNGTASSSNRKSNSTSGVPVRHPFIGGAVLAEVLALSWWLM